MRSSLDEGDEAGEETPTRKSATSLLQKLTKIGSKSNS
jgi:hypothetical protein